MSNSSYRSFTDDDLVELEERRPTASRASDDLDDQLHSSVLPSSPPNPPPPPLLYHSLPLFLYPPHLVTSSPQVTSTPPPGSHVEQLQPQPQYVYYPAPVNLQQVVSGPAPSNAVAQEAQGSNIHPSTKLWSLYLKEADKEDDHLVQSWKGDTGGILIFTGLFAATVATFLTQTYQLLVLSSDDTSAAALLQVSQQLAGLSNGTLVPAYIAPPFEAPFYAVWVNTLWFLSLFLSLTGALMATLMQQWTRRYLRGIGFQSAPHIRGPKQVKLRLGVEKYKMRQAVTLLTFIIHASVFIFFTGLVGFAFNLNSTVASVLAAFSLSLVMIYVTLSILPAFSPAAPYDTVLTPALQASLLLGPILFAYARKRVQRIRFLLRTRVTYQIRKLRQNLSSLQIRPLLQALGLREAQNSHPRDEDSQERVHAPPGVIIFSSPAYVQEHIFQQDKYLNVSHATHALDRILTNADEHSKVEGFLDSMVGLLVDHSSRHSPLLDSQTLEVLFKQYSLGDKIRSLIYSCDYSNTNVISLSTRVNRLRTVLAFICHGRIRVCARLHEKIVQPHSPYKGTLETLVGDLNPFISFLSRLVIICSCMETNVDSNRYYFRHISAAVYGWYDQARGQGTDEVAWPLYCFMDLVCTVFKFIEPDDVNDPVAAYRHLWEPILRDAKGYLVDYLEKKLRCSEHLVIEPIPRALLIEAGLEDFVHPFYSPPTYQPPTGEEQLKIKYALSAYPILIESLREVAEVVSLVPLYSPAPQAASNSEVYPIPLVRFDDENESIPYTASSNFESTTPASPAPVLFGPLTWHTGSRPHPDYRRLFRIWGKRLDLSGTIVDVREVMEDYPKGKGYATITFANEKAALGFVDAWMANPLPAYRSVTAELVIDSQRDTSENGKRDGVDAEEDQAQGGRED